MSCHHCQPACCHHVQPHHSPTRALADIHERPPVKQPGGGVGKYVALGAAAVIALVVISAVVAVLIVVAGLGFFAVIGVKSYIDIEKEARRNPPVRRGR